MKIGVLCSGDLGFQILRYLNSNYEVSFVLTDSRSIEILEYSAEAGIPSFSGNPRDGSAYVFVKRFHVDVIASVNYLFLIESDIINHARIITFNIHGSLLPKYRGRTPHVWAIINGETEAGITAHKIDDDCDTGPIIRQVKVPIEVEDTGAMILEKYAKLYPELIDRVLKDIQNGQLAMYEQDESQASYFGKRTPEDGQINWDWSMDQIRNWVRAQAYPYPGAFAFLDGKKIIIDRVSNKESGTVNGKNGEIVSLQPLVTIKVKDGLVILEQIRTENHNFMVGKMLSNENRT